MRKISRWDMLCVGLLIGCVLACLTGCNTVRGFAMDLQGMSEGSAANINAPNRIGVRSPEGESVEEGRRLVKK